MSPPRAVSLPLSRFPFRPQFDDFGLSMCLLVSCPLLALAALVASNLKPAAPGLAPKANEGSEPIETFSRTHHGEAKGDVEAGQAAK